MQKIIIVVFVVLMGIPIPFVKHMPAVRIGKVGVKNWGYAHYEHYQITPLINAMV